MISAAESSENEQHKRKMKWRGRKDSQTAKKKRATGKQKWTQFSIDSSGYECCVSFVHVHKQIRTVLQLKK